MAGHDHAPSVPVEPASATVLALWSFGRVLARSCALSAVSHLLAKGLHRQEQTVRQPRRAWDYNAPRKRGTQRPALHVATCFPGLLGWVVRWWHGTPLALALDATAVGTRLVVLAVSVGDRGCAIPGAWGVLPANTPHAWRREWLRLLRWLRPALPRGWTVIVVTERGVDAPWLFWRMVRRGWPPFLRINTGGTFRPAGTQGFRPLKRLVPTPGPRWRGRGTAFQQAGRQVEGTLLALWEAGHKDPWLLLTDLPPAASDAGWDGLRAWLEQGFKLPKRAGWQWRRTRRRAPERAARRWRAVAVATRWLLSVGGMAADDMPESTLLDVTAWGPGRPRTRRATRLRLVSVLRQGWVPLLVALLRPEPLPADRLVPEPWPAIPPGQDEASAPALAPPKAA